jgi:hypothetical protein
MCAKLLELRSKCEICAACASAAQGGGVARHQGLPLYCHGPLQPRLLRLLPYGFGLLGSAAAAALLQGPKK